MAVRLMRRWYLDFGDVVVRWWRVVWGVDSVMLKDVSC